MRRIVLIGMGVAAIGALSAACSSSGGTNDKATQTGGASGKDGGSTGTTAEGGGGGADGGSTSGNGDGGTASIPKRLLVTFTGSMSSEMVALDMQTKQIDGRLGFPGFGITNGNDQGSIFLLEQNTDIIAGLSPDKPWDITSLWSVALPDGTDGGSFYSQPMQVIVQTAKQAYALRYERNNIAVFDQAANGDGGTPMTTVDLAGLVQTGDADGVVDMLWGTYVASMNRIYIVLGNVNQIEEAATGNVMCGSLVSTVTAIDTQSNQIVDLGGTGPKGSIALTYYNPLTAVYDSANDRILVVSAGCYDKATGSGDGGVGAARLRGIEAVALGTSKTASLIDLDTAGFPAGFVDVPTSFAYIDDTHAVIGFDQTGEAVYMWNPSTSKIGAVVPNAPDVFTYDGNGNLLGTLANGANTQIVSVAVPHGESTTLATNITSLKGQTYTSSVELWPHP